MAKKKLALTLPSVDDLFSSQAEREDANAEKVVELALKTIEGFPGHPFRVTDDDEMAALAESIAANGVLVPLTVRKLDNGKYRIVSGHRRKRAAEIAGLERVPCVVRSMTDDEAIIAMVDSNLQRETILPSERAHAYSMRLEAMKRQGQRTDLTCAQVAHKSDGRRSRDILAEELGVSKDNIQRFIRLTYLTKDLLDLVDEGRMKMLPAVEVSYLSADEQDSLYDAIQAESCTPSHAQARKLKRYSKEGSLTPALIRSIMEEQKPNQVEQFRMPRAKLSRYFKAGESAEAMERRIIYALELLERIEREKREREMLAEAKDGVG